MAHIAVEMLYIWLLLPVNTENFMLLNVQIGAYT